MTHEGFVEIMMHNASEYAIATVADPEQHEDAVQAVIEDYMQGAEDAWNILNGN